MRTMILILPFLIALPGLVMAEAPPDKRSTATQERRSSAPLTAEEFLDLPEAPGKSVMALVESCVAEYKKFEDKFDNCMKPIIIAYGDTHPPVLAALLVARMKLVLKKRFTGEISPEEAQAQSADAYAKFDRAVGEMTETGISPEDIEAIKNHPMMPCKKSKTDMERLENCKLPILRNDLRKYPTDLVELLAARLRLAAKKQSTGKISKEEEAVLVSEAFLQFSNEIERRMSLVRQEERRLDDQERQMRMLEHDARRRESDSRLRESEYKQERLRREREDRERERARFDRALRDINRPVTQTDCSTDMIGSIHCTTR